MQNMTLEQLRATTSAGDVKSATLKGQGDGFFIEIATRSGQSAFLTKARSAEPRRFGNPASALLVLRDVGITIAQLDATQWRPNEKGMSRSRQRCTEALGGTCQAVADNRQLTRDIEASIADPRPSIPHDQVMVMMDSVIAALMAAQDKPTTRERN